MQANQWRDKTLRVTRLEDGFYNQPLREATLFRFLSHDVSVEPHEGAFSIKFVLSGSERYDFFRRTIRLRPGQSLLVNAGETYGSLVDERTESLSLFYPNEEVRLAAASVGAPDEKLLDDPGSVDAHLEVAQIPTRIGAHASRALAGLIQSLDRNDIPFVEEAAKNLLIDSLNQSFSLAPYTALKEIVKRSTRDELVTRTYRAKCYIDEMDGGNCQLDDLAAIACMSKYHFLRVFQRIFGETPAAYARKKRMEVARCNMKKGLTPNEVARRAEYSSLRAFQRAYQQTFGERPPT